MYKSCVKRILDLTLAILLLPFLFLLTSLLAPLIFIEDGGSPFYISERLGKGGRVFKMYKFRTMMVNAPDIRNKDGSTYNSGSDSRLTKLGRLLRSSSIDELPQIINILKNDMSFIGPRPDLPEHIRLYSRRDLIKLKVLPGITGYNQAYFRNAICFKERLKNDVYYVKHISFLLDLRIFFKTIVIILTRKGIYVSSD